MTLFDSFSKPGWQHKNPEVRKAAIDELEDEAILLDLINSDPEPEIRSHALSRLTSSKILDGLSETLQPPLQNQARAQRLKQLLPDPENLRSVSDDQTLIRIATLSDDPELIAASISRVQDMTTRMELAGNHPLAKVRLCAAQGIDDIGSLKELMHLSKHKDKSVFRYCKEVVDRHNTDERIRAEREQQIRQLAEDARGLSTSVDSPEFKARFLTLEHRWSQLREHANPESLQQIGDDLEICAKRVARLTEAHEAEEARQAQTEAAQRTFKQLITELEGIVFSDLELGNKEALKEFTKSLDAIEDRWVAAMHDAHPASEQTQQCKQQLNHWRDIVQASKRILNKKPALEKLQEDAAKLDKSDYMGHLKLLAKIDNQVKKLPWPESVSEATPTPILELHTLRGNVQQKLADLKKEEKKTLGQLETAFGELRKELDDNHFKNADRLHNRVRNLLRHLSPDHQEKFQHELRPLTARLSEIHDWQGFAIEPKKIELCERMADLVGSNEPVEVLAAKIKALQDEWKTLGSLSPRRDQELWKKFHAAAEEAYAPCKQAFKQQAKIRKENFRQRMELIAQLTDYDQRMAWPGTSDADQDTAAPDWRMVQKTLDTARAAFNAIQPLSGKDEHKSRKALQVICDRIYGHIKDEYERNISRKEQLVGQANALVEMEPLKDAIDRAKAIQREWKDVGMTPRQVDRRLWKDFRSACDAVFARLDEERKQVNTARNERAAAAKERAEQARQRALKEQQRWPNLLDKLRACAIRVQDEEQAKALWEKEKDIPKGIDASALKTYWQKGPNDKLPDDELRQACIAMEVFLSLDSPPEDKEARMAYQMSRLLEGLGSQQDDRDQQLLQQVNNFIALRPQAAWLERFCCGGKIIPPMT